MEEYIKYFETQEEYDEYVTSGNMKNPNVSYCEDVKDVHYNPWTWADEYFTIEALEDGDIKFVFGSGVTINDMTSMSYSTDGGKNWILIENNNGKTSDLETTVSVNSGDKILFKGIGNTMCHIENGTMPMPPFGNMSHFESTIRVNVMGNIMSLVFGDNYKNQYSLENRPYCFAYLYTNVQGKMLNIISAENLILPATTLANQCYQGMFSGCKNLTTTPAILPATTLTDHCYNNMFYGCTSLTSAPQLPATTLTQYCYSSMFQGCTSLTSAPQLPATTLTQYCYSSMFNGCTSLTSAPQLPATTLADGCYSDMFRGCTNITSAPELTATSLTRSCYSNMFQGCTSLTSAPELPATTLADYCYQNMFRGCTSLTSAPELTATTLKNFCYQNMFQGCTGLTSAPELPAKTLVSYCYHYMFQGCTSLNYIKAMFTTTPSSTYTQNWVDGVAASGTFVKNSAATWNVSGVNGVPSGWTVETATV